MGNNKYKILIVEDEANIRSFIKANLETSDYQVLCAETCALGMMMYASHRPDLIVLDLGLPDRDGMSLIQEVRKADTVPIIVLSARSNERDKVEALDLGANDYITKPFGVMELISRVKAMLRRSQKSQEKDKVLKLGNIVLDREKHSVTVGKEPVELTYKEYELLKLLMTNAGIVTTRELILDRVWGIDFEGESRTLDMHIKTLRQKLKEEGSLIKTVRNVGYIMNGEKA